MKRPLVTFVLCAILAWSALSPTGWAAGPPEGHPTLVPPERKVPNPKSVRIIYLVSQDRRALPEYRAALEAAAKDLQRWYARQLGGSTFRLNNPLVEVIQSDKPAAWFYTHPNGEDPDNWGYFNGLAEAARLLGARPSDPDYVWLIYSDGPGDKGRGGSGVAVLPEDDLLGLVGRHPTQKSVPRWVAGMGHELGHAFGLLHPEDLNRDEDALMNMGIYGKYPDRTYLTPADKEILRRSPFFVRPASAPALGQRGAAATGLAATNTRPNLVLILTDDQGYGDAGCNGHPMLQTPNLDRMYREGVHFEDFHVSPTCSPTRSSLLSGKHEFKNGVTHTIHERERMSLKSTTLAQLLKSVGYTTGIFGKWHLGDEEPYQPQNRGFDEVFIHGAGGIGQSYPGSCGDAPKNSYFSPVVRHNGRFEKTSGYCTDVFFDQAMKWMESIGGRQPFFLYLTPNAPHAPLDCPPKYEKLYSGRVSEEEAKFLGMVANIDENVGRLLARLEDLALDRNTLVVFLNDNGGTVGCNLFNAGMRGQKGTSHNGGTRAMSLWRWPGTLHPAACDQLTAQVDVYPTFAELAGAQIPAEVRAAQDGFSLVPLLKNPRAEWHQDRILMTHVGRWPVGAQPEKYGDCSVRWQQYLLWRGQGSWALYDLKADPGERNDLAVQRPQVVAKLDQAYDHWWATIQPCLENESAYKAAPVVNPFKELYWKQYGGPGPNHAPRGEAKAQESRP